MQYELESGDHLVVRRGLYTHHGVYSGRGTVIHYSGELGSKINAIIREDHLQDFVRGDHLDVVTYDEAYPGWRVVSRARSRLGENGYRLFGNNCEHFARWCKMGDHRSEQVDRALLVGGVGTTLAVLRFFGPVGAVVSALGTVGLRLATQKRPDEPVE